MGKNEQKFMDYMRDRLIWHQKDYQDKKKTKGEEFNIGKMHKAINQRNEIKKLSKVLNSIIFGHVERTRQMIKNYELKNTIFVIDGDKYALPSSDAGGKHE